MVLILKMPSRAITVMVRPHWDRLEFGTGPKWKLQYCAETFTLVQDNNYDPLALCKSWSQSQVLFFSQCDWAIRSADISVTVLAVLFVVTIRTPSSQSLHGSLILFSITFTCNELKHFKVTFSFTLFMFENVVTLNFAPFLPTFSWTRRRFETR